jgi:hypothetical protein
VNAFEFHDIAYRQESRQIIVVELLELIVENDIILEDHRGGQILPHDALQCGDVREVATDLGIGEITIFGRIDELAMNDAANEVDLFASVDGADLLIGDTESAEGAREASPSNNVAIKIDNERGWGKSGRHGFLANLQQA